MAGAFIHVTIDDSGLRERFQEIKRRAGSMQPVMKIAGEIIVNSVHENFVQGGRPVSWKPLAASTLWNMIGGESGHTIGGAMKARAAKKLANKKILIGRGALMRSIHSDATATYVDVGSPMKYAAIHQLGGKTPAHEISPYRKKALAWPGAMHPAKVVHHPGSTIPARPFLMVHDGDFQKIADAALDWLTAEK